YFQYLSANLTPRSGACGKLGDCSYAAFANMHSKRRRVVFAGANDGFLHAFDSGVYDRDDDGTAVGPTAAHPFNDSYDLGTGREISAYALKTVMSRFPGLLAFPPPFPQYFVDGSVAMGDVFIDTGDG